MPPLTPTEQGYVALRAGDPATALDLFREALDGDATNVKTWKGVAQASRVLRIWAEVVRALEALLPLVGNKRDVYDVHVTRALILDEHLGDPKAARTHYETALMVDPHQTWPYLALAALDLRSGTWSRAIAHAAHGLEFCEPDAAEKPWLLFVKGVAMQQVSMSMGPVSTFFRGLAGEPGDVDPSEQAIEQATERLPELANRTAQEWLEDPRGTAAWIQEHMPKAAAPTWWL